MVIVVLVKRPFWTLAGGLQVLPSLPHSVCVCVCVCVCVVAKMMHRESILHSAEWEVYKNVLDEFSASSKMPFVPDIVIYMQSSPDVCLERIERRSRDGEHDISLKYLSSLHDQHERCLANLHDDNEKSDGDNDLDEVEARFQGVNVITFNADLDERLQPNEYQQELATLIERISTIRREKQCS